MWRIMTGWAVRDAAIVPRFWIILGFVARQGRTCGACQESCVRGRFHLIPLFDAEPVAEHNRELCHGGGPFALRTLPLSADTAQGEIQ